MATKHEQEIERLKALLATTSNECRENAKQLQIVRDERDDLKRQLKHKTIVTQQLVTTLASALGVEGAMEMPSILRSAGLPLGYIFR